jgi:predicted ribosome quality control (RQC) complex YloA/Tae2 family protein
MLFTKLSTSDILNAAQISYIFRRNVDNNRMISNYFTLLHAARVLDGRCRGASVREIYTQEKRRLCLGLERTSITTIVLSCVPSENAVYVTEGGSRARKNAADLFPGTTEKVIASVGCDGMDRSVSFVFTDGSSLRCDFFGVRANIFTYAPDHRLTDCFLHKAELMESGSGPQLYRAQAPMVSPENADRIIGDLASFSNAFGASGKQTALAALKIAAPKLGAVLAEELLYRSGIDAAVTPSRVSDENLRRLYDSSLQSVSDLLDCNIVHQARIYWDERRAVCFSLVPLQSKPMFREESYDDLFEAVRRFIAATKSRESFGAEKETVHAWLEREIGRTDRTLEKMEEDALGHNRAGQYETSGMLLMAHLHEVKKGMASVVLADFSSGEPQTIALDRSLTPVQNAERYYQKAKHAKAASLEARERRATLVKHAAALRPLLIECEAADTRDAMRAYHARFGTLLKSLGYMTETELEHLPPFRIFTVEGGFQVLAGKSSENNDLLTTKYAKPNDLWFHARGSSGSHVVLKVASAPGDPTKKAVHQAASIAAYYSKMKTASAVPVAMTEKKFVHKPKGVPAGTVTLDREKVIFVEPKLPDTVQHP